MIMALALISVMSVSAAVIKSRYKVPHPVTAEGKKWCGLEAPKESIWRAAERKVSENDVTHKLTVKAVVDPDAFRMPWDCMIGNGDIRQYVTLDSDGKGEINVPEGTYMLFCVFDGVDPDALFSEGPKYIVIREDVDMDKDMEIVLDPTAATIEVSAVPLLPSGEPMAPKNVGYSDPDPISGGVEFLSILNEFYYDGMGILWFSDRQYEFMAADFNPYKHGGFWITPTSERLTFMRRATSYDMTNGYYITCTEPLHSGSESFEFSTDYTKSYVIESGHTELYDLIPEDEAWPSTCVTILSDYGDGQRSVMPFSGVSRGNVIKAAGVENVVDFSDVYVIPGVVDYAEAEYVTGESGEKELVTGYYWWTELPAFSMSENVIDYQVGYNPTAFYSWSEEAVVKAIEPYSFCKSQGPWPFASSQPTFAVSWGDIYEWDYEWDIDDDTEEAVLIHSIGFTGAAYGRMGEVMNSYMPVTQIDVKAIDSDKEWDNPERTELSRIEAEFSTSHQTIDGLRGVTSGQLYWDERKEDKWPPVITMMQFRNSAGDVTDRFTESSDGVMRISGADFNEVVENPETNPEVSWIEGGAEIEVEWRPTGDEGEWTPFSLTMVDGGKSQSGFGPVRETSLNEVKDHSATGWYDVRITMTDAAGNYTVQTVSPAFKIEANSGIEALMSDRRVEAIYDLQGRKVADPKPGIYLVKRDGRFGKEVIR